MKTSFTSAVALAAAVLTNSAVAQTATPFKGYIGAEYGAVKFKDQTSVASALVSAVGGSASSVQDTGINVGRFFGGINLTENVGAELGYVMSGTANANFSGVSRTSVSYSGSASQKVNGFDYSALIRPNLSTGFNGAFLKVGGHSLSIQTDVSVATGSSSGLSSATTSGTGSLIGIGYDGKINEKLDFRIAYTAYNSVAGISGNDTTLWTIGLVGKF